MEKQIGLFEGKQIRRQYDSTAEVWYFSIVDIVGVLTEQPTVERARNYWKVLKKRLLQEGNETVTNCNQLKLQAEVPSPKPSRLSNGLLWRAMSGCK
jgi:hypothetical protein